MTASNQDDSPVVGEVVNVDAIQPSPAQQRDDARGRVGNTAVQAGTPGALLIVAGWAAALADIDLAPGAGTDLPANVAAAIASLLTVAMAWFMNRRGLKAT